MQRKVAVLACAALTAPVIALAQNGYVGIYADPSGASACTSVPQGSGTVLYVLATVEGTSASGITGAEFRIEVSNSTGWFLSYNAPIGTTTLGNVFDTDPANPADGSGLDVAFSSCQPPSGGKVTLGTISVFNLTGGTTTLAVKRHSSPPNPSYSCPLFVLCDAPYYSKSCMSSGSEPPCSLLTLKPGAAPASDTAVFVAGLNTMGEGSGDPDDLRPAPGDLLARRPVLLADLSEPDIVGLVGAEKAIVRTAVAETLWIPTQP